MIYFPRRISNQNNNDDINVHALNNSHSLLRLVSRRKIDDKQQHRIVLKSNFQVKKSNLDLHYNNQYIYLGKFSLLRDFVKGRSMEKQPPRFRQLTNFFLKKQVLLLKFIPLFSFWRDRRHKISSLLILIIGFNILLLFNNKECFIHI